MLGATALVVGAIVVLATGSWWALGLVLLVHLLGGGAAVAYALNRASQSGDKPDPVTEARLEEEEAGSEPRPHRTAGDREVFN